MGIDTDKNILMKVYTTEYKSKDCTIYSRASNPDDAVDSFRHYIGGNPGIVLVHTGPINPNEIFIQNKYLVGDATIIASSCSEALAEGVRIGVAEYGVSAVSCAGPHTEIVDGRPVAIGSTQIIIKDVPQEPKLGTKYDGDKPRLDLVLGDFSRALLEVGKVGTFGAKKYEDHNWLLVKEGKERYSNALLRHYLEDKTCHTDGETGLLHLAHLAWNALAVLELSLRENDNAL